MWGNCLVLMNSSLDSGSVQNGSPEASMTGSVSIAAGTGGAAAGAGAGSASSMAVGSDQAGTSGRTVAGGGASG